MKAAALGLLLVAAPAGAEAPIFFMTLARAEEAALARSPSLAAARSDAQAAAARGGEALAMALPRLSLDGSYRYQTEIPRFSVLPGAPAQPFGDHRATSVGPALSWTLWDEGALLKQWRAQKSRADSAAAQERLERRQVVLGARMAYFQLQLAREQLDLLADSLGLADEQYADIARRQRAGAVSRLDALSAHQEALQRRRDYLDAEAALGAAWSELALLTGDAQRYDPSRPVDARRSRWPEGLPLPTLFIDIDGLAVSSSSVAAAARIPLDPAHPRLRSYEAMADAARLSASAASLGAWPKILLSASFSYDYPNGPVLQSVWQKTAGVSASVPLLEFGRSRRDAQDWREQAAAAESRRLAAADGLARDRAEALEHLAALEAQTPILERSVAETDEIARLTYASYRGGHSTFLEVQSANVRALEAKNAQARADAQALIQLSILASLAPEGS